MQYGKIIFVSEENLFTSPVAEAVMKRKLQGEDIEIESRGTVVLFPEPANPKGVTIAKSRGIDMEGHRAKSIDKDMFGNYVLVLAMTEKIKTYLYEQYNNAVNVYTIKEFVGMQGDVETPYGKSLKEYGESYTQIENLINMLIEKIK